MKSGAAEAAGEPADGTGPQPSAGTPARPTRAGRRRWIVLGGIAFAAALGALLVRAPAVPVARVERRPLLQKVVATGRVATPARVRLGALLTGRVVRVAVDEGDAVARGDVLVELDGAPAEADVAQADAAVQAALARVEQLRSVASRVDSEVLQQARIGVESAESQLERTRKLAEAGASTEKDLDDARRALDVAQSRLASAKAQATGTAQGGGETRTAVAQLAQARAALEGARVRLAQTRIVAPADGVVLTRAVEPGDVVQPGTALLVLARSGELQIEANPDEKNLGLLAIGQEGRASADAFADASFPVRVAFIAPAIDPQRGTVEVKLAIPDPPKYLRPDMTVSVDITVAHKSDALVAPAEAIRAASGGSFALAVRDGRVVRQPVKLGIRGDGEVEVIDGLAEGEALIVGAKLVEPGARVRARAAR